MVQGIDLKPLTDETINEMGYNTHDLWLVKIGNITFGPYETESLKHYVGDNEHLFEEAHASRMDNVQWLPFWEHTVFQRRKVQAVGETHEGPFWLMDNGLKIGPLSFHDIDKKIEMGLLVMTDHISIDDGHHWKKIYEIEGFDRRTYSPDELPIAPLESSFQQARLVLVEKMEQPHVRVSEELAEMAWAGQQQAKVIQFKIDEMTLEANRCAEVSSSLKWAVPTAAAVVMALVTGGYFMFSVEEDPTIAAVEETSEKPFYQKTAARKSSPRGFIPSSPARTPASVSYGQTPQNNYNDSRYPTQMDMHENYESPPEERDPLDGPVTDVEQPPQEHSLVGNDNNPNAGESLDAAMSGVSQPAEQPIVDEASDF